mmetsp:Transcript_12116/g.27983  ORF Transcript_12116/g.27983 Transcript_12116/m.27983 type:complete len:199 (+) Transcript_12116:26-622(+)
MTMSSRWALACVVCCAVVAGTFALSPCPTATTQRTAAVVELYRDFWPAKITNKDAVTDDGESGDQIEGFGSVLRRANKFLAGKCITQRESFLMNAKVMWQQPETANAPAGWSGIVAATGKGQNGQSNDDTSGPPTFHVKSFIQVYRFWYLDDASALPSAGTIMLPNQETIWGGSSLLKPSHLLVAATVGLAAILGLLG